MDEYYCNKCNKVLREINNCNEVLREIHKKIIYDLQKEGRSLRFSKEYRLLRDYFSIDSELKAMLIGNKTVFERVRDNIDNSFLDILFNLPFSEARKLFNTYEKDFFKLSGYDWRRDRNLSRKRSHLLYEISHNLDITFLLEKYFHNDYSRYEAFINYLRDGDSFYSISDYYFPDDAFDKYVSFLDKVNFEKDAQEYRFNIRLSSEIKKLVNNASMTNDSHIINYVDDIVDLYYTINRFNKVKSVIDHIIPKFENIKFNNTSELLYKMSERFQTINYQQRLDSLIEKASRMIEKSLADRSKKKETSKKDNGYTIYNTNAFDNSVTILKNYEKYFDENLELDEIWRKGLSTLIANSYHNSRDLSNKDIELIDLEELSQAPLSIQEKYLRGYNGLGYYSSLLDKLTKKNGNLDDDMLLDNRDAIIDAYKKLIEYALEKNIGSKTLIQFLNKYEFLYALEDVGISKEDLKKDLIRLDYYKNIAVIKEINLQEDGQKDELKDFYVRKIEELKRNNISHIEFINALENEMMESMKDEYIRIRIKLIRLIMKKINMNHDYYDYDNMRDYYDDAIRELKYYGNKLIKQGILSEETIKYLDNYVDITFRNSVTLDKKERKIFDGELTGRSR